MDSYYKNYTRQATPAYETSTTLQKPVINECRNLIKSLFVNPKYSKLTFTTSSYIKLMSYINLIGDYEITGLGRVVDDKIVDVKILRQKVKPAYVSCDSEAIEDFMRKTPKTEIGQWVLDWHSHVNMAVSPSGTDTDNWELMQEIRLGNQFPVMIVNKKQEFYSKCYINSSRKEPISIDIDAEEITDDDILMVYNECRNDIETLCLVEKTVTTTKSTVSLYDKTKPYNGIQKQLAYSNGKEEYCKFCGDELVTKTEQGNGYCNICMYGS